MKIVIYPARFNRSNAGEILINVLLVRELSKHARVYIVGNCDDVMHYLTRNNPFAHRIITRSSGCFREKLRNAFHHVFSATFIIDPPGHYFDSRDCKGILKHWKCLLRIIYNRLFGIRCIRIGATVGPYTRVNWLIAWLCSLAYSKFGTRELQNFEELHARGFSNLLYTPDPAFLLPTSAFQISKDDATAETHPYISITLRGAIPGVHTGDSYYGALVKSLTRILPVNRNYFLSCQAEDDLLFMMRLFQELQNRGYFVQLIPGILPLDEALEHYRNADAVVTNRLQVALPALLNNTPAFALTDVEHHSKLVNLYTENGLENMLLNIYNPQLKQINLNEEVSKCLEAFAENARQNNELLTLTIQRLVT